MQISATIITFNEETKIAEAIKSVSFADEILVVDSESTDKTREIAEALGAKVIIQKWLGFARQKQFAVDSAQNDWILSLDADERISEELKAEILNSNLQADGWWFERASPNYGRAPGSRRPRPVVCTRRSRPSFLPSDLPDATQVFCPAPARVLPTRVGSRR